MNWLYYLAEANLYLCVFYVAYCVFLANETHYQLNRIYLLVSCVMAFVLPVVQLGALRPQIVEDAPVVSYLLTQPAQSLASLSITSAPVVVTAPAFTIDDYLWMMYVAGAVVLLLFLVVKLYSIFKLTRNNKAAYGSYKMVYLKDTDMAFSFFNYLFIGTRATGAGTIITHELVHIRQKHSADIMFLELLKVICWFNPCVYLLQKSLKTVHEYIADEQTAATETDALTYSSFLVNNAYGAGGSSITHSFFNYNLLKKRIIMLNQQRSGKLARLKYLVAVPLCAGLLCASTLAFSKSYGWIDLSPVVTASASTEIKNNGTAVDTLVTSKGYKIVEKTLSTDRNKTIVVEIYDADGEEVQMFGRKVYQYFDNAKKFVSFPIDGKMVKSLKDKYGYDFPRGPFPFPPTPTSSKPKFSKPNGVVVKMSDVKLVQVPPGSKKANKVSTFEIRAKKTNVVKFPRRHVVGEKGELSNLSPQVVKPNKIDVVKFPPQPPKPKVDQVRFPPKSDGRQNITNKGYKFEETGFLIGKETNFRVIIHEKNGEEQSFFKNSSTKEELKLLKDKYGYTFPNMEIWDRMPPPPPMPPAEKPAKPTSSLLNKRNSNGGSVTRAVLKNVVMEASNGKRKFLPLIIVNNQRYTLSKELQDRYANGEHLVFSATDSTASYVRNTPYAISKWGPDAAEGVVSLYGKTLITTTK